MLPYREYVIWLLFLLKNNGIRAFFRTGSIVRASLTYLDSFNRCMVRRYYIAFVPLIGGFDRAKDLRYRGTVGHGTMMVPILVPWYHDGTMMVPKKVP